MNTSHKVIKVVAMVFAVYLFITIITGITTVAVMGMKVSFHYGSEHVVSFTNKYEDINYITVENSNVAISILPTEEKWVTVKGKDVSDTIESEQIGNELVIHNKSNLGDLFSWLSDENKESSITIFIPKDTRILKADIESGSNGLDIRDMNVDHFILDGGSGDITISGVLTKEYEFDLGSGDFVAKESKLENGELDSGSGRVEFKDCTISDTQFETGSGTMEFDGTLLGDNVFDGGSGDLSIKIYNLMTNYDIDIDLGSGHGYINEKRIEDEYYKDNAGSDNTIMIDGGSGRINLDFLK